ncbi:ComF family protein [bacterium]|jgi:ComF family protein|nr:ComF family protein [bacterium]MBT3581510.1 ComF family protein [bacterium]MBT4551533.1 ComF family protein [bacterium]MBT5988499.1 ComF family protein [bacterium]MBT7088301.1 ComF family protein [bacterium]
MNFFKKVLDIFLPGKCYLCNEFSTQEICDQCFHKIAFYPVKIKKNLANIAEVYSLSEYDQNIKKTLTLIKFNSIAKIANQIANLMRKNIKPLPFSEIDYWVPVPIHKTRLKKRGFNQVDLLFKDFINLHKQNYQNILIRTKNTKSLFDLGPEEREKEIKGVFDLCKSVDIRNKNICILDDIITTGATAQEIALLLQKKGAHNIYVLTVCYGK